MGRLKCLLVLMVMLVSMPLYAAPDCDCSHLAALRQELKNARTLQTRFQQQSANLRSLGPANSSSAFQQFAQGPAGQGIQSPPGYNGPTAVEYVPAGDNLGGDSIAGKSKEELCGFSKNTEVDLGAVATGANCKDIAEAVRAHEEYHHSQCLAQGYQAYRDMHGSDRAIEEANAYNAQSERLREGIRHVLEKATVEIWLDTKVNTSSPPQNPLYTGIGIDTNGRIKATNNTSGQKELRFEGNGTYQFDFKPLGGHCTPNGVPATIQAKAIVTTDGETAKVSWQPMGTMPQFGMRCSVPGGGRGFAMSIPVPFDPKSSAQNELPLPFEDGAKIRMDMAKSQAAQILSQGHMALTGYSEIGINILCSSGP